MKFIVIMSDNILNNKVIISTHSETENDSLSEMLINSGVKYFHLPLIKISENDLSKEEIEILENINSFQNLIFTSKNGVNYFFKLINKKLNHKIFTIGKATDKELLKYGYKSDYINEGNNSVIFSQNLANFINENDKTLLILGNLAPDSILNSINKYSSAQRINVYKTEKIKNFDNKISNYIENNKYDLILFSSPSAFYSFKESFPNIDLKKLKAACIGNITAKALLEQNIKPVLVADKSDYEGFIISIKNHFKKILN